MHRTLTLSCVACLSTGLLTACPEGNSGFDIGIDIVTSCPQTVIPKPGTVITDRGAVTGLDLGSTWAFLGVPYAQPPTFNLRFAPPRTHDCWQDDRRVTNFAQACIQLRQGQTIGVENCLTLNIWTPKSASTSGQSIPVLIYMHGGSPSEGSAGDAQNGVRLYDGQAIAETANAVVVTVNYRLGPLGFLTYPEFRQENLATGATGNFAILDQLQAIQWVQANIDRFGGDKQRVVVIGQGSGGLNRLRDLFITFGAKSCCRNRHAERQLRSSDPRRS